MGRSILLHDRELVFGGNFLDRFGVLSSSLEAEWCLSDLCVDSGGLSLLIRDWESVFDLKSGLGFV
jgi:hypothetical protein